MADTKIQELLTEQSALTQSGAAAADAGQKMLADAFKRPEINVNPNLVNNTVHAVEATAGGALLGAAVVTPVAYTFGGPAMGMLGGFTNAFMRQDIGAGVDLGFKAATRAGLQLGLKGGAIAGLAAFGAYKGYEYLTEKP